MKLATLRGKYLEHNEHPHILINPEHVVAIYPSENDSSEVYVTTVITEGSSCFYIKGTPEEVAAQLREAQ